MRGNQCWEMSPARWKGSIPAYAGEPVPAMGFVAGYPVYPRVCGGTPHRRHIGSPQPGLSPRMRGNQSTVIVLPAIARSIPAYAGEPARVRGNAPTPPVYPRVCGGTALPGRPASKQRGLSPRMRGNRAGLRWGSHLAGSIPAYAGEPSALLISAFTDWVYPRVCGGTHAGASSCANAYGLSPRMRGNLCGAPA